MDMFTINEIRSKFLAYYEARGHAIIPSSSIVPQNDPTTLFTGSGMQQLMPYLLGEVHPKGTRLADSQKSFRAEDIDEVGDNRHTTFFEMLGNWSLGDYFKNEQLPWVFTFLTDELNIDPSRIYVTVFAGDDANDLPRDDESVGIWKTLFAEKGIDAADVMMGSEADAARLGMRGGRIFYYDVKKNWWSRAGTPTKMPAGEPGGSCSEIFYDFGTQHDPKYGDECHPNCDCGRFMEIGNSVFMQYLKKESGAFGLLPKQNVDFGGGLERFAAAANDNPDMFEAVDVLKDIIVLLEHFSGKSYKDSRYTRSFRIVADHMRAATFMLSAGVTPSNTERGYILRRWLRRAAQHAQKLDVEHGQAEESILVRSAIIVMEKYRAAYPEFEGEDIYRTIVDEIWKEEKQFGHTLEHGIKEFEKMTYGNISAEQAFTLFTTYGFPFEMTKELALERELAVDEQGFYKLMEGHKELSRAGSEQKFKGGLADVSTETTRLHTAHHLLLKALQIVLGDHVRQRGSNITAERLRIDFSHGVKMTPEEIKEVERIVNEKIAESLPVTRSTLPKDEAEQLGAQHEFGTKYPDMVSVYSVGPKEATQDDPQYDASFSIEFCGGPHVQNTAEIGKFTIKKEEAVAAGIRRIKAMIA
jgi:alanyl-tRNA synthetase